MPVTPSRAVRAIKATNRFVVAISCAVLSCAGVASAATLHPGDTIDVVVFYHPELSTKATISGDGTVQIPVAGSIESLGLTSDQLATRIQERLDAYVPNAGVKVALEKQGEFIFVAGGPAGSLRYSPGQTLVTVMNQLQFSPTQRPERLLTNPYEQPNATEQISAAPLDLLNGPIDFKRVTVKRDGRSMGPYDLVAMRGAGEPGPVLQPGDTIELVNKPIEVTVTGEVPEPGPVYLYPDDSLIRALDQVGGTTGTSSQSAVTLIRGNTSQLLSIGNPTFSQPVQNGDKLIVPRAPRIDVLGTVVRPGETYLRGNQTLVSAIYYAGGPDRYANLKAVQVFHNGVKTEYNLAHLQKGHEGDNPPLVDGDVVFVPQGSTIDPGLIFQAIASLGFLIYR